MVRVVFIPLLSFIILQTTYQIYNRYVSFALCSELKLFTFYSKFVAWCCVFSISDDSNETRQHELDGKHDKYETDLVKTHAYQYHTVSLFVMYISDIH